MKVGYSITAADLELYFRRHELRLRRKRPWGDIVIFSCFWLFVFGGWLYMLFFSELPLEALLCALVPALLAPGAIWLQRRVILTHTARKLANDPVHARLLNNIETTIDSSGLHIVTQTSVIHHTWSAIIEIDHTELQARFYFTKSEGVIIPRHAFDSDSHYNQFIEQAISYHTLAIEKRNNPPSCGEVI
jgi:hypothetical protein